MVDFNKFVVMKNTYFETRTKIVDKIKLETYNRIKETNTMINLNNIKLNNWWNVWDKNHPYRFVVL